MNKNRSKYNHKILHTFYASWHNGREFNEGRDGMSEVTERPWQVSKAVCGSHSTEVTCIYHYPNEYTTVEVVEPGCRCGEQAMTEANARHIVHCVNNHERLVEALREAEEALIEYCEDEQVEEADKIHALLATLEAEKGGEL